MKNLPIICALLWALSLPAQAAEIAHGDLRLDGAWARATVPAQRSSGAFIRIQNLGPQRDRLLAVSGAVAEKIELHSMVMEGETMKMRAVEAIDIPPGATLELKPGGYHIMFHQLSAPLAAGSRIALELRFERAGVVSVPFAVEALSHRAPAAHSLTQ